MLRHDPRVSPEQLAQTVCHRRSHQVFYEALSVPQLAQISLHSRSSMLTALLGLWQGCEQFGRSIVDIGPHACLCSMTHVLLLSMDVCLIAYMDIMRFD